MAWQESEAGPGFLDEFLAGCALVLVRFYRRWLSPLKGFSCAHNHVHRTGTCSTYGLEVFRSHGFFEGKRLLNERFAECGAAARSVAMSSSGSDEEPAKKDQKNQKSSWSDCWPDMLGQCACDGMLNSLGSCKGKAAETGGRAGCKKAEMAGDCCGDIGGCSP